jgi:GMP synthase (glutamine-hydrolysing)
VTSRTKQALAIRHVAFEDLGVAHGALAARGYDVTYLEAGVEPITPELALAPDLLVVLGGPIGVYETTTYPFLTAEQDAISARLAAGRPIFGVCLGAQLIAAALGAAVTPTGRKEIGYAPLQLTAQGRASVLAPLDAVPVLHWHGDQFAIPAGAVRLAATPGFPNQAFTLDKSVLALQFHIEADPAMIERWLIGHACELAGAGLDPATIRADAAACGPALATAGTHVLNTWLDALPS